MSASSSSPPRLRWTVAVTGPTGDFGSLLLPLLARDPRVERVVAIGRRRVEGDKIDFRPIDLTRFDAEALVAQALRETGASIVFHLAVSLASVRDPAYAHELEVAGTQRVVDAVRTVGAERLVVPSLTAVYGASARNPALLTEASPLEGCEGSRFIEDKIHVEQIVAGFARERPSTHTLVLRFAPPIGPSLDNPVTRLLRRPVVPTLLGFDPRWQAIHEHDVAAALHIALETPARGVFNIVGRGTLPFSELVATAGARGLPMPSPLAGAVLKALRQTGGLTVPMPLLAYLRHACVSDGALAERAMGFRPTHHARDAAATLRGGRSVLRAFR